MRSDPRNAHCPKCAKVGRQLGWSNENAYVEYYRCDSCRHVWSIDRKTGASHDVAIDVTTTAKGEP